MKQGVSGVLGNVSMGFIVSIFVVYCWWKYMNQDRLVSLFVTFLDLLKDFERRVMYIQYVNFVEFNGFV